MRTCVLLALASAATGCCFGDALTPPPVVEPPAPVEIAAERAPERVEVPPLPVEAGPLEVAIRGVAQGVNVATAPGAAALFERAAPHEGALERSLLACRATVRGAGFDDGVFAGGADVSIAARLGRGQVRRTPQSAARVYTLPVARLAPGDDVWIRVLDDDVLFDDTIAEGSTRYARFPFALTMGQADVECRAVSAARVAVDADEEVATMAYALDRIESVAPRVDAPELGYPRADVAAVVAPATRASAWLEPSDPQLATQIERALAFDRRWRERARDAVRLAMTQAPAPGTTVAVGRRRATVSGVACGAAAAELLTDAGSRGGPGGCVMLVTIEAGDAPLHLAGTAGDVHPDAPLEATAIDAWGAERALALSARRDVHGWVPSAEERALQPGQALELVLGARAGFEPVLLRLRDAPGPAVVVRLEP